MLVETTALQWAALRTDSYSAIDLLSHDDEVAFSGNLSFLN